MHILLIFLSANFLFLIIILFLLLLSARARRRSHSSLDTSNDIQKIKEQIM